LRERGPDYQAAQFVNQVLGDHQGQANALVFLRHYYYLNIPSVNGDPDTSFVVDPQRLQTTQDWSAFFATQRIAFVVRSPSYPISLDKPLQQMEAIGRLIPIARAVVDDFEGKRIEQNRIQLEVLILRVQP
jgi:hypothetical protein